MARLIGVGFHLLAVMSARDSAKMMYTLTMVVRFGAAKRDKMSKIDLYPVAIGKLVLRR